MSVLHKSCPDAKWHEFKGEGGSLPVVHLKTTQVLYVNYISKELENKSCEHRDIWDTEEHLGMELVGRMGKIVLVEKQGR